MATTKKSTEKVEDIDIKPTEQPKVETDEQPKVETDEQPQEQEETKKVADKKYVVLDVALSRIAITKEQYDDIKKSASNVVESETDDTIFIRVIK